MKVVIESLQYNLLHLLQFDYHFFSVFFTMQVVTLKYCQFRKKNCLLYEI